MKQTSLPPGTLARVSAVPAGSVITEVEKGEWAAWAIPGTVGVLMGWNGAAYQIAIDKEGPTYNLGPFEIVRVLNASTRIPEPAPEAPKAPATVARVWAIRRISDGMYFDGGWRPLNEATQQFVTIAGAIRSINFKRNTFRNPADLELALLEIRATDETFEVGRHSSILGRE